MSAGGSGSPLGRVRFWSVNTWLIAINIAVFVLDGILPALGIGYPMGEGLVRTASGLERQTIYAGPIETWGHFSASTAILGAEVWRFITFQFLHANLWHILMNMMVLFFFGRLIEQYLGSRRYLAFYLLCGVAGPVAYLGLWASGWLVASATTWLIGASAGVFGVLIASAVVAPDATVLIMGIFPAKLRHVAIFVVALAAYTVVFYGRTGGHNAGGEAAHLGGAALGYLLIRRPNLLRPFAKLSMPTGGEKKKIFRPRSAAKPGGGEVDRVLRKVHEQGLASLSEKDKRILRNATDSQRP